MLKFSTQLVSLSVGNGKDSQQLCHSSGTYNHYRPGEKNSHSTRRQQPSSSFLDPKSRDGRKYDVRYAGAFNKWPFLHLNAAKLFWISTIFKAGAKCHRFHYPLPEYPEYP